MELELNSLKLVEYSNNIGCCETCVLYDLCCNYNYDEPNEELDNLIDKCVEIGGNHHYVK